MKAAVLKKTGGSGDLRNNLVIEDIPLPEINEDELLINVKSASLNHRDLWIAKGLYSKIKLPVVLGSDCSGIISETGKNVKDFKAGDEVILNPGINWGTMENFQSREFNLLGMPSNGTFSEYVKINKSQVYCKPKHLTFEQASAIPTTGITAYRALYKKAELNKFDNILITGAGGGVAAAALVFAVNTGAKVFVTSGSDDKIKKAVTLGAAGGVNYNNDNWHNEINELTSGNINTVIDGTGGDTFRKCIEIVNYGGRLVCYGATHGNIEDFPMARLFWKQLKIFGTTMGSSYDFTAMMKCINDRKIIPVTDKVFSIEEISDAFLHLDSGKQFGKIVLNI